MRLVLLIASLLLYAGCKKKSPPASADTSSPAATKSGAGAQKDAGLTADVPPTESLWLHVIAKERTWELLDELDEEEPISLVRVKLHKRRQVGKAVIAELEWSHVYNGGEPSPMVGTLPGMIVADGRHVVFHESGSDSSNKSDDELIGELNGDELYDDPPKEFLNHFDDRSSLLKIKEHNSGPVYCIGEGPPAAEDFECPDTCFANLCYSKKDGIVRLNGRWAPEFSHFSAAGYAGED